MNNKPLDQIVFTLSARCRDCYRCVRVCPVKAIRMENGQAYVDKERCISCGTCVRECPQQAKAFRLDVETVMGFLKGGEKVAVSLAPSFAAVFNDWQVKRLPSALRACGFSYIGQTSQGAYQAAAATSKYAADNPGGAYFSGACPAFVDYVEKYYPKLTKKIIPVASPMVIHARMLKAKLGSSTRVVFIGPCVAKKSEADWPENKGVVDAAMTFAEMLELFKALKINLAACEESAFDEAPGAVAQLFPLPGGLLKSAGLNDDGLQKNIVQLSAPAQIKEILRLAAGGSEFFIVEPLFCWSGCINGPAIGTEANIFQRRKNILEHQLKYPAQVPDVIHDENILFTEFKAKGDLDKLISDEQIQAVLNQTGKANRADELNCGACGYDSCRDKAAAVVRGLAESSMCIPYMRRLAERKTDLILENSPNGMVVLDSAFNIISTNRAFRKFFSCGESIIGKHISVIADPAMFESIAASHDDSLSATVEYKEYNLLCHQIVYALREERQYVGIFVDVTSMRNNEKRLREIKGQIVSQAHQMLQNQIEMAQNIAKFLGESTAKGEELANKLMMLDDHENK